MGQVKKKTPKKSQASAAASMAIPVVDEKREAFEQALMFAKLMKTNLWDVNDQSTKTNTRYTRFSKEDLLNYMQTPSSNEKNIRNASIYMYDASTQYKRLIQYYSFLPEWAYTLSAVSYDPAKVKGDAFRKAYYKAATFMENMNPKHEMQKATNIALRDGILYGAIWQSNSSFYIQRINPDYCVLTSCIDGTWNYSVDMSQLDEKKLAFYPPEFTTMWNAYRTSGVKWQEVPDSISFCLKADETNATYSLPPWASTLPMLYDIETYKALQETATEIANYKLLAMKIDTDDKGVPLLDWNLAQKYYTQLCASLPPFVGAAVTPMKIDSFEFDKSKGVNDVDTVSRAEEQFWFNTGTSALLHGSMGSKTAGVLNLSVKSDEEIVFGLMAQVERLVNRLLKNLSGTVKFKVHFLPVTKFNRDEQAKLYKEPATLGIPGTKAAYAATVGVPQTDLLGMNYIEMELLGMGELTPLQSGYTQSGDAVSGDEGGRPETEDTELTDEGEATREKESNANAL